MAFCERRGDTETVRIYREYIQPDERAHQQLGQRLLAKYATTPELQQLARDDRRTAARDRHRDPRERRDAARHRVLSGLLTLPGGCPASVRRDDGPDVAPRRWIPQPDRAVMARRARGIARRASTRPRSASRAWPSSGAPSGVPVATSQRRTARSSPGWPLAEASWRAVGRERDALDPVGVTEQRPAARRAVGHVPQPDVAVVARRRDERAVGRERDPADEQPVAVERRRRSARRSPRSTGAPVRSLLAVASSVPSGEYATQRTASLCPRRTRGCAAGSARRFHSRTVVSRLAEASIAAVGGEHRGAHDVGVAVEDRERARRRGATTDAHAVIEARGREQRAVGREHREQRGVGVAAQRRAPLAGRRDRRHVHLAGAIRRPRGSGCRARTTARSAPVARSRACTPSGRPDGSSNSRTAKSQPAVASRVAVGRYGDRVDRAEPIGRSRDPTATTGSCRPSSRSRSGRGRADGTRPRARRRRERTARRSPLAGRDVPHDQRVIVAAGRRRACRRARTRPSAARRAGAASTAAARSSARRDERVAVARATGSPRRPR